MTAINTISEAYANSDHRQPSKRLARNAIREHLEAGRLFSIVVPGGALHMRARGNLVVTESRGVKSPNG